MPNFDQKGPPVSSTGPRNGQGEGKGNHVGIGEGTGPRTGGEKGTCASEKRNVRK